MERYMLKSKLNRQIATPVFVFIELGWENKNEK